MDTNLVQSCTLCNARCRLSAGKWLILWLLVLTQPALGQQAQEEKTSEKLRLLHANEMTGVVEGNQQLRRLIDNVRFRHGQTDISCNLAIDYPGQERWLLIGNVLIKDKEKTLKADTVIYVAKSKLYRALRNVELMTDSTKIFCDELNYDLAERKAIARYNVRVIDQKENTELTSGYAEHHRDTRYTLLKDDPVFVQYDSLGEEETRIVGETMEAIDGGQRVVVDKNVVITLTDIRATCGHAEYFRGKEKIVLTIDPVAYQKNNRLTGTTIELLLKEGKIQQVHVLERALAEFVPDSSAKKDRPSTISGKKLVAYIAGDFVEKIDVNGTATCVYYVEENGIDKGVNRAQGDSLTLLLSDNAIRRIIFESSPGKSTGKFLPPGYENQSAASQKQAGQKSKSTAGQ